MPVILSPPLFGGRRISAVAFALVSIPRTAGILRFAVESHVIPAKAGIQFFFHMDPRFRGGDVLTFISLDGPLAHEHSE
jgi:hypothetical protein